MMSGHDAMLMLMMLRSFWNGHGCGYAFDFMLYIPISA
jgi:hypothetical protein